jgi:2-polyprenyl-3-methyl-5-hydroxy-6-metoxy-1,4-benzoquinol methylase|tara:strand:- start:3462 stop:4496 length:1035 start_codon:yes stop_codon:yes gene_type:complete
MYNENYSYDGSATTTLQNHHISMANQICERFKLKEKSLVMDIGSNAGVLLSGFRDKGMKVLGIDPSINVANIARKKGIDVIGEFFSSKLAKKIREEHEEVSVITGTNVFAHIDDLDDFFKAADIVLSNDGIIVIEAPYLITLLDDLEYDTIYHEHLSYISVKPLKEFCKKMNMDIFDAELNDIHGGSLRLFIGRKDVREISKNIETLLNLEEEKGIYKKERLEKFSNDVKQQKKELNMLLWNLKKEGKKIVGISAPAKGNALTNYCKISTDLLDYITEKSPLKIGKFTPGMHIPILSDDKLLEDKPDYGLILAWNFADEIIKNNEEFRKNGGKFIIPIPHPKIV